MSESLIKPWFEEISESSPDRPIMPCPGDSFQVRKLDRVLIMSFEGYLLRAAGRVNAYQALKHRRYRRLATVLAQVDERYTRKAELFNRFNRPFLPLESSIYPP